MGTLLDQVTALSLKFGDKPAFGHVGARISFTQVDVYSRRFADYLREQTDLKPGQRIALHLPNIMQYPVALFGALRAGLVVVNTNPLYTQEELEFQLRDADVSAVVGFAPLGDKLLTVCKQLAIRHIFMTDVADLHTGVRKAALSLLSHLKQRANPLKSTSGIISFVQAVNYIRQQPKVESQCQADDLALLQYTGGTTGTPKGAMLTFGSLSANLSQLQQRLYEAQLDENGRLLQPLPIYHIYSLILTLSIYLRGDYTELVPDPRQLRRMIKTWEKVDPTVVAGINPLFNALLQQPDFVQLDFSSLKLTVSGGMAMTHALAEHWQAVTGCNMTEGYGLTECSPVVCVNQRINPKSGWVGKPLPGTEVCIVDSNMQALPVGETGELLVKGPQLMSGYWRQPDETEQAMHQGWLLTGDIAEMDAEGNVRIIDRRKEMINVSGFNVYPSELENIISAHPDIQECAVIGVPDEETGESIRLYVVSSNPRLTIKEVRDYCRERLTAYKVPRSVEFCHTLPRTPIGKLLRRALREEAIKRASHASAYSAK